MIKRLAIVLTLFAAATAAIFFLLDRRKTNPAPDTRTLTLLPQPDAAPAWPLDQTWSWSFRLPPATAAERRLALTFRESIRPLAPDEHPGIRFEERAMPASQATREFGTGQVVLTAKTPRDRSGTVTIQLVDLSSIGAASVKPGQNLRVLGTLATGGAQVYVRGDESVLPVGRFAGTSRTGQGEWTNGELYLMTFLVASDGQVHHYDALLECKDEGTPK